MHPNPAQRQRASEPVGVSSPVLRLARRARDVWRAVFARLGRVRISFIERTRSTRPNASTSARNTAHLDDSPGRAFHFSISMNELENAREIAMDSAGVDAREKSLGVLEVERTRAEASGAEASGGRAGRSSGRGGRGRGRGRPKKSAEGANDLNASLFWLVQVRMNVHARCGDALWRFPLARGVFGRLTRAR